MTFEELRDSSLAAARLADAYPAWRPGSSFGYHGLTIGARSLIQLSCILLADPSPIWCHADPSTRATSARIRVRRASPASAESRCPAARAVMVALGRLLKRDRITSALSARTPPAKFSGPTPAAKAISRHRQMSAMSVSLDRTLVAWPLSTRALTSSAKGNSHCRTSPLRRRSLRAMVTGGRASASWSPGTSVVKRSSPTWTFSCARLVYAGTRTSMSALGSSDPLPSFMPAGMSDSPRAKRFPPTCR